MKILVSLVSLAAFLLVTLPGPLYKFAIIDLATAFSGFKYAVITGVAALILLIIQALFKRQTISFASAGLAVFFSLIAIVMPLKMMSTAKKVPAIHDISTDMTTPPEFVAIAPLRVNAPNPVAYAGTKTAEQQSKAYPELQTLTYTQSKAELVTAIEQAADNLGWDLVNTDKNAGLVEATDATLWFGFKDDIVVRIEDNGNERLVDIRSKSRIGSSDLGKNAERIHGFIKELNKVLGE